MRSRFHDLDLALIQARRVFEVPALISDGGGRVEGSTLLVLAALGQLGAAANVAAVASCLAVSPSTASRLITRAEVAGMVTRAPSAADRREQVITATPAGRDLDARAGAYRRDRLARLLADFTDSDAATLAGLLTRLAEAAGREPA